MKSDLIHLQLLQAIWHFTSVILSIPTNPFSNLLHEPMNIYQNNYLLGMPEDQSAELFITLHGCGVWLCPNQHLYFVDDSTTTEESGICPSCGAAIGQEQNANKSHHPAFANHRIGRIDRYGNIIPDNPYFGAVYGMKQYDAATLSPKGYVYIQGKDSACRHLDEISVRIVRWMVNAIIIVHHSDYSQSQAKQFTKIPINDNKLMVALFQLLKRYTYEISKLTDLNIEETICVLHAIIDKFYCQFPKKYTDQHSRQFNFAKHSDRQSFEKWMVEKCIHPIVKGKIHNVINDIHQTCSSSQIMKDWSNIITQNINFEEKEFYRTYLPKLFQPFRPVSFRLFFNAL
eukprot:424841_1